MIGGMKRLVDEMFEVGSYCCKIRGMIFSATKGNQDGQLTEEQRTLILLQAEGWKLRNLQKNSSVLHRTPKEIDSILNTGKETLLGNPQHNDFSQIADVHFEHRLSRSEAEIQDEFEGLDDIPETVSVHYEFDRETFTYRPLEAQQQPLQKHCSRNSESTQSN